MDGGPDFAADRPLCDRRFPLDRGSAPFLLIAEDGKILLANVAAEDLFGYPREGLAGQSVDALVPKDVRDAHPDLRAAFLELPRARRMGAGRAISGITRDGASVPLEIALESVQNGAGERYVLATITDLRARGPMERTLRRALDAAFTGMILVDPDRMILLANRVACEMFGYPADGLIGQRLELLLPERYHRRHPVFVTSFIHARERREMARGRVALAVRRDGSEFPVQVGLTPIETEDGILVMSSIQDMTETRDAAERIRQQNKSLSRLNEELTQYAYSASHDLKAPLTTLTGLLRFVEKDIETGDLEEAMSNVLGALALAERQTERVERLMSLLGTQQTGLEPEDVCVERLVEELWADVTDGVDPAPVLSVRLGHTDPFRTDRARLTAILDSLLSNTVRFADWAKPEQTVCVCSVRMGDGIQLSVADNGIGIPTGKHEEVFKLFRRFNSSTAQGSGLGLALARKHAEQLGGEISFETSSKGTVFTLVLPILRSKDPVA